MKKEATRVSTFKDLSFSWVLLCSSVSVAHSGTEVANRSLSISAISLRLILNVTTVVLFLNSLIMNTNNINMIAMVGQSLSEFCFFLKGSNQNFIVVNGGFIQGLV